MQYKNKIKIKKYLLKHLVILVHELISESGFAIHDLRPHKSVTYCGKVDQRLTWYLLVLTDNSIPIHQHDTYTKSGIGKSDLSLLQIFATELETVASCFSFLILNSLCLRRHENNAITRFFIRGVNQM